jgi:hypothetical protein
MNGRLLVTFFVVSLILTICPFFLLHSNQKFHFPIESETSSNIKKIGELDGDKIQIDFDDYSMKFHCDQKQWKRVFHCLNQDWKNRFDHTYRFTYQGNEDGKFKLLSFYREE